MKTENKLMITRWKWVWELDKKGEEIKKYRLAVTTILFYTSVRCTS